LARIARIAGDAALRERLLQATSETEVLDILAEEDATTTPTAE
jgi:mannitol/fructose-specific phosphotransferase system IIA component (Ntr-type)